MMGALGEAEEEAGAGEAVGPGSVSGPDPWGPESPLHSGTGTLGQPCCSPEPRVSCESPWRSLGDWACSLAVSDPPCAPEQRLAPRECQEKPP